MREYELVVGLEIHAELNTKTKIFCACKNEFGAEPNTNCCPVCMGFPGVLPVLNRTVVDSCMRMGTALGCKINRLCKSDRKNYFYPDLPKAYQISQFDLPVCESGAVDYYSDGTLHNCRITRIHIEEDAGKLTHDSHLGGSLVDYNRCGVPLIEIVTEPDLRSSRQAKDFLETIRIILLYLGISDCKMQEGSIRCDINVSVREKGSDVFGTRVEMKNVNSFSAAERAIDYEYKRQIRLLESGGTVEQETRRWDDVKGKNTLLRSKEDAFEYRYFPDPDLCPIVIDDAWVARVEQEQPELPVAKLTRYYQQLGLPYADAEQLVFAPARADFFDQCLALAPGSAKQIANWLLGDVAKRLNELELDVADSLLTPQKLVSLLELIEKGTISQSAGKKVLQEVFESGKDPAVLIEELGLVQISDTDSIRALIEQVLAENEKSVNDYKSGKMNAFGCLVGQSMKASRGKANPKLVNEILKELLS